MSICFSVFRFKFPCLLVSNSYDLSFVGVFMPQPVGLGKIARLINMGMIDSSELITMKTLKVCLHTKWFSFLHNWLFLHLISPLPYPWCFILKDTGAIGKQIGDGVRLMGRGCDKIEWPIHLEVLIFQTTFVMLKCCYLF